MTSEIAVYEALKYHIEVNPITGTRVYYDRDDLPHRVDGPAVEFVDGTELWYQHGLRHRTDGPAIVRANGVRRWFLYGKEFTEENHRLMLNVMVPQNDH